MQLEKQLPKVYIIILTYNRWVDILECLECTLRNHYANYQVIVIDNGSEDKTPEVIKSWAEGNVDLWLPESLPLRSYSKPPVPKPVPLVYYEKDEAETGGNPEHEKNFSNENYKLPVILIQSGKNRGFSGGVNVGLRYALAKGDGDYAWLLNPDIVMEPDCLEEIIKSSENKTDRIFGTVIKNYSKPDEIVQYGGAKINNYTGTITNIPDKKHISGLDYICGGSLFAHTNIFRNIGLLPENYFIYWEETDWCTNAVRNNIKLEVCDNAVCYDKISSFMGKGFFSEYYYTLGALKYFKKYNSSYLKYIRILNLLRILKRVFTNRFQNVKAITKAMSDFRKLKET